MYISHGRWAPAVQREKLAGAKAQGQGVGRGGENEAGLQEQIILLNLGQALHPKRAETTGRL